MKRIALILFAVSALISCGPQVKVWESPIVGATSASHIEISKVEITQDTTFVYMSVDYPPMNGFTFGPQTYIETDGSKYSIKGCDSFELGDFITTDPTTWHKDLTLYFESIPKNTKIFDLLEGDFPGAYNFFNVHEQGYKFKLTPIPADYLADYPEEDQWPAMEYSENPVTLHFKAINFKKGMSDRMEIWHFDIADPHSFRPETVVFDENGEITYTTRIYYPQRIQVTYSSGHGWGSCAQLFIAPGEELSILVDMNVQPDSINDRFVGFKGYMAKFNKWSHITDNLRMFSDRGDATLADWTINHAKTVQDLIVAYDSVMTTYKAFVDRLCDTEMQKKHLFDYELRYFDLVAEQADSLFRTQEFLDFVLRVRPACFFGNEIVPDMDYYFVSPLFAGTDIRGIGPDFCRYLYAVSEIRSGKKVEKPFIEDANLSNLFDRMCGDINAEIDQNKTKLGSQTNIHYFDLVDVAPENILQTILDQYKGKVVLLDLWATWCGWCVHGHREMAPFKEEVKDKDIVFVYLTSTTSPFEQWIKYTSEVPGEHYYLTDDQYNYLYENMWLSRGVPAYAIYDRTGKCSFKQVGWKDVETLSSQIGKALRK